jgi:membrane-bound lytic murein transglycosylase D
MVVARDFFFVFAATALLIAPLSVSCTNEPSNQSHPSLVDAVRLDGSPEFCSEPVPLDEPEIKERMEKEMLLMLWDRPQVVLWLKRAGRYFPVVEKLLAENRVPADLKYVAVVESALRSHAASTKAATGFWQFRESVGIKYGLKITDTIDERREIHASTRAATAYFQELHDLFGSWTLAAAAYNMGEEGLRSEILLQKTSDFYRLQLPEETQRFVVRIVAAKTIMSDPAKYGFHLGPEDLYRPVEAKKVRFVIDGQTPVSLVAEAAGTYFKRMKDLNPQLKGHYLSKGEYDIFAPLETGDDFSRRLAELYDQWTKETNESYYIVKQGDNLYSIAQRFDVPLPALLIWNEFTPRTVIYPGDRIVVYSKGMKSR